MMKSENENINNGEKKWLKIVTNNNVIMITNINENGVKLKMKMKMKY